MTEITGYCPGEGNAERRFVRADGGISLIGNYKCKSCGEIYREVDLNLSTRDGEGGDLVKLIELKLAEK